MLKINKTSIGLSLLVATILAVGSVSASAEGANSGSSGSGGGTTETTHKSGGTETTSGGGTAKPVTKTETETETNDQPGVHEANEPSEVSSSTELHHRGDTILADMKTKHDEAKTRTPEQRTKACESHKKGLTNKFSHIVTNAQKTQTRIDGIYTKALAFQTSTNAQPAGIESLISIADGAKANSAASIAALKAITPTIDCNSTSVASDVATFKAAAQQTRDNLKAYRTAVKAVIKALETTKTSEGSTN